MTTELVARLRDADMGDDHGTQKLLMDAADELERLTRAVESSGLKRLQADIERDCAVEERRTLLMDAADDCIECANYLSAEAPNMGTSKERRYRALAGESVARAAALRKWAEEFTHDVGGESKVEHGRNCTISMFDPTTGVGYECDCGALTRSVTTTGESNG